MIRPDNYLHIAGWMITDLNLKGNQLLIYALIYGFSQAEGQEFHGTISYIAEWCNSTVRGVQKAMEPLLKNGLIERRSCSINGVTRYAYRVSDCSLPQNKERNTVHVESEHSAHPEDSENEKSSSFKSEQSSKASYKENINNKNNNIYTPVIAYLNEKAGTSFKPTTEATRKLIRARIKDGFTLQDFKTVIDNQCRKWKGTEWQDYLRPSTLFAPSKFEGYLNARSQQINTRDDPQIPARERIEVP